MEHRLRGLLGLRLLVATRRPASRAVVAALAVLCAAPLLGAIGCAQADPDTEVDGPDIRQLDTGNGEERDRGRGSELDDGPAEDAAGDPEPADAAPDATSDGGPLDGGGADDPDLGEEPDEDATIDLDDAGDLGDTSVLDAPRPDDADADDADDASPLADADAASPSDRGPDKPPVDLTFDEPDASVEDEPDASVEDEPDAGPLPTPDPGVYLYDRMPVAGLSYVEAAAFHPDGSYFVLLDHDGNVHLRDVATGTGIRFAPPTGADYLIWHDVVFSEAGDYALFMGEHEALGAVVYRFEDATYRALGEDDDPLTTTSLLRAFSSNDAATTAVYPPDGGDPLIVAVTEQTGGFWSVVLWETDPETGDYTLFDSRGGVRGACTHAGFVSDLFDNPGLLLACNLSVIFFSEEEPGAGYVDEDVLSGSAGNVGGMAVHPSGDYALVIGWSGRRVYRFERGLMGYWADAPQICSREPHVVSFQPNGRRALIAGGAVSVFGEVINTAVEFRHDLLACGSTCSGLPCDLTDVSFARFDEAPYGADSSYFFPDVAWSPTCDGGVIVGGKTDFRTDVGMVVTFEVAGGRSCWDD